MGYTTPPRCLLLSLSLSLSPSLQSANTLHGVFLFKTSLGNHSRKTSTLDVSQHHGRSRTGRRAYAKLPLSLKKRICVETMKRYTFFCHCSTHNSPVASQIKTPHSVVASGAVSASACPHDASQLFMCCTPFRLICYNAMQCWPETDFVSGGLNSLSHRDDSSSKGASLREKVRLFGWRLAN